MKRILFFLLATACLTACGQGVKVTVSNPVKLDRTDETVELAWRDFESRLSGVTPETIVVLNSEGVQQPSQVLFEGGSTPQTLIFQATVPASGKSAYRLNIGERENYTPQAYGRFVPERKDDFAWENNRTAHRMYGPALEATGEISNGIDVWLKRTDSLIINKWYAPGFNYHQDTGDGLDCYKVGRTLGCAAMAPYEKDSLWLGNNFTRYEVLDNGPLRIAFRLDYAPFNVAGKPITESRTISLDANTQFNRVTELYTGDFDSMRVAVGVVMRSGPGGRVIDFPKEPIYKMGYWEPLNKDNAPDNGNTGVGVVFPTPIKVETRIGHLLGSTVVRNNQPYTYRMGAAWSKSRYPDSKTWTKEIADEQTRLSNPLIATF